MKKEFVGKFAKVSNKNMSNAYGVIDEVYEVYNDKYGFVTANPKDGSWTGCLVDEKDVTICTSPTDIAVARKCAKMYVESEQASLQRKMKQLERAYADVARISELIK